MSLSKTEVRVGLGEEVDAYVNLTRRASRPTRAHGRDTVRVGLTMRPRLSSNASVTFESMSRL